MSELKDPARTASSRRREKINTGGIFIEFLTENGLGMYSAMRYRWHTARYITGVLLERREDIHYQKAVR